MGGEGATADLVVSARVHLSGYDCMSPHATTSPMSTTDESLSKYHWGCHILYLSPTSHISLSGSFGLYV